MFRKWRSNEELILDTLGSFTCYLMRHIMDSACLKERSGEMLGHECALHEANECLLRHGCIHVYVLTYRHLKTVCGTSFPFSYCLTFR